jgi:hypothetical protein
VREARADERGLRRGVVELISNREAMSITLQPRIAWQVIDGEGVVLDLDGQRVMGLNDTAVFLLERLPSVDESSLAAALAAEFDVSIETARADVNGFLAELRRRGLAVET